MPKESQRKGDLQITFGVDGERDLTEHELPHLGGWRGQPARADRQRRVEPAPVAADPRAQF